MKPYYSHKGIDIYHGDCVEVMRHFPKLEDACVVCDPPYGRNCDLNTAGERIANDSNTFIRDFVIGLDYPSIVFGSPKVGRPIRPHMALVWDKSELTGMGDLSLPWKQSHEEIYVFGTGFRSARRRGSILRYPLRPLWTNHPSAVSGEHPNEKPLGLLGDLVECCPWQTIIDPTCGVGTTLQAAKLSGKAAIGIELEERYCEIAAKRLAQEILEFA